MLVFTVLRVRTIGGIETAIWIMAGVLSFLVFRRTGAQSMNAKGGKTLFANPQIRPVDPVLVSAGLEGFLMLIVTVILLAGAWMFGLEVVPTDPLAVMEALLGMWLLGVGFGLIGSVANQLIPPIGAVMSFTLRPLYFLSGVMFPVTLIPYPYLDWIMMNPLVHGLEAARLGFAPYYHVTSELSIAYLYGWALVSLFFGFALHVRYAVRLDKK
jgi:capsular polysaccharide transport system permease protein